ncbi:MAG: YbgA family protein [Acidobacteriota bacterium]
METRKNVAPAFPPDEIRVGISACLLGQEVRFDGGHKHDPFLTQTVGPFFTWVPVCPEVELGLGIPRETIRLERRGESVRLVAPKSGRDLTEEMRAYAEAKVLHLASLDLSGYILKKDSPSCGMERVRVYGEKGMAEKNGRGAFAERLLAAFPLLPVEEEGRLHDPRLRDNFFVRVFAYHRLKALFQGRWTVGGLVRFHSREKLLLLAHDPKAYTALGRLVASAKEVGLEQVALRYQEGFVGALRKIATVKKNTNVLQHMAGYLKALLSPEEKRELHGLIEDYHRELVPLIVPVTLLRHYVRLHRVAYLEGQTFLEPSPKELMLRNHV